MYFETKCDSKRKHVKCGGRLRCRYEGRGRWYSTCDTCGQEKAACPGCKKLRYPKPEDILAILPDGWFLLERGAYRCIACTISYDVTMLYRAPDHVRFAHDVDLTEYA